jgi:hypothetical protein
MQIFDFGKPVAVLDRNGNLGVTSEYRLHVQGGWRFLDAGVPFVTYDDIRKPTTEEPGAPFDPDLGSRTLRDELLEKMIRESTPNDLSLRDAAVTEGGELELKFGGGAVMEVDPAVPGSEHEAWRLLMPDGTHAVMSGSGFAVESPMT